MKARFLFICILFVQLIHSQTVKIPGTKCSMVPPPGFKLSSGFSGFQEPASASSIMITEIPSEYNGIVSGFTAEALRSKGMELVKREEVMMGKSKALLIKASQMANGIKYLKLILIFGAAENTVLVNAIYKESFSQQEPALKTSLLTTSYDAGQNADPAAAAPFSVDVSGTGLKLVKYMGGSLIYSVDGKIPTERPMLIAGGSLGQKVAVKDQKEFCEARLRKLPKGESLLVKNEEPVSINGMSGYELEAYGLNPANKPNLVYQVILFDESGNYYIIVGQSAEDMNTFLQHFKKTARSFRRK